MRFVIQRYDQRVAFKISDALYLFKINNLSILCVSITWNHHFGKTIKSARLLMLSSATCAVLHIHFVHPMFFFRTIFSFLVIALNFDTKAILSIL